MAIHKSSTRSTVILLAIVIVLASAAPSILRAFADEPGAGTIQISTTGAGPREVEETTQKAIERQYTAAWKNMTAALKDNRADLLDAAFVGSMRDQLARRIEQQKKSGTSTRYADGAHQVNVVFYSPEGTALELRDTTEIEQQTLDGSKVIHSEKVRQQYLVIFTLVEDRWKVRIMQALPTS
ncbi:MAG: hypothetical protein JWO13_1561 [Acidobacteriales bacterium]|nr:hypothetical protein [Terriglobales bacterium]